MMQFNSAVERKKLIVHLIKHPYNELLDAVMAFAQTIRTPEKPSQDLRTKRPLGDPLQCTKAKKSAKRKHKLDYEEVDSKRVTKSKCNEPIHKRHSLRMDV